MDSDHSFLASTIFILNSYFAYSVISKTKEIILEDEGKLDLKTTKKVISNFESGPLTIERLVEDIDFIIKEINHYFGDN